MKSYDTRDQFHELREKKKKKKRKKLRFSPRYFQCEKKCDEIQSPRFNAIKSTSSQSASSGSMRLNARRSRTLPIENPKRRRIPGSVFCFYLLPQVKRKLPVKLPSPTEHRDFSYPVVESRDSRTVYNRRDRNRNAIANAK